jgi:hypothetical protein
MAQFAIAGFGSYCNYGYESSYNGGAVSARVFGHGTKITIGRKNNMEPIWGLGARNASTNVAKKFEGNGSVDFFLSNGSFFRAVLGAVADTGGPSYAHTYTEANTLASFAIDTGSELGTTDEVVELKGCVATSCSISAAVNELVKVKLDFLYANETLATSGIGSQVSENEEPFVFHHGTLEIPDTNTISFVQNFDLTIDNGTELIWGLGSRAATANVGKQRKYGIKITSIYTDPTIMLTKFYGASGGPLTTSTPASQATLQLTFTNGGAGSALRSFVINLTNIYFDTYDITKDVNDVLKEDLSGFALGCTSIIYTNATASDDDVP